MTARSRSVLGGGLVLFGLLLWGVAATQLHDLAHRLLGVVLGGALTAAGIALLAFFR
jgi:hypothetical protein